MIDNLCRVLATVLLHLANPMSIAMFYVLVIVACCAWARDVDAFKPPQYPDSYTIRYNLTLPYLKEVQPDGLR